MRSRFLAPVAVALLVGTVAACSSLLGLNDFEDAPTDGGAGQGGTGGTAGMGGASGSAGTAGAGGAAGSGGQTGLQCDSVAQQLEILTPTDLEHRTFDGDRLFVASNGKDSYVAVVTHGGGTSKLFVRSLHNEGAQIQGGIVSHDFGTSQFDIVERKVIGNAVHFLGQLNGDLADVSFPIGNNGGDLEMPAQVDTTPSPCTGGGTRAVRYAWDGSAWHNAVTCESNADGGIFQALYVDGNEIDSGDGTTDDLVARKLLVLPGGYALVTGNDFGPPILLRYGANPADLKTTHDFSLSTDSSKFSALFSVEPRVDGSAAVVLGAVLTGPAGTPKIIPADLYGRSVTLAGLLDLVTTPAKGFANLDSFTTPDDIAGFNMPTITATELVYAGPNPLTQSNVHFMIVDTEAKLLFPSTVVYGTATNKVIAAATGRLDVRWLVAWGEVIGNEYSVRGQQMFCY